MNRRRNKVDMEKVFATVISLAIMVALVVGVVSILKSNNSQGDDKQNYIDLNEINEALSGGASENETSMQADNREAESGDERSTERIDTADSGIHGEAGTKDIKEQSEITGEVGKSNDAKTELPDEDNAARTQEGRGEGGNSDVAQNTGGEGQKEQSGADSQIGNIGNDASGTVESGEAQAAGERTEADGMELAEGTTQSPGTAEADVPAGENLSDEAAPVNASTATLLGYDFNEESTMMWPAVGNVILNYNMTNTIYFPTLDVYRCNPAIVIGAEEDSVVSAAADGIVIAVYETNETGLTMEIALGNDYVMTYGQLKNLTVGVGSQVKRGDVLGAVAAPSQYYTEEGSNLYFRLDKAGTSVNPMDFIEAE